MSAAESRIAVLGAGGQLGRALTAALGSRAIPLTRADVDLAELPAGARTLDNLKPCALINAAAYTDVDRAETDATPAFRINGDAAGFLARWSLRGGIPFMHFSTDYVFSGAGTRPWTEQDPASPVNVYGRSKLEGERQVSAAGGRSLIVRTAWIYDRAGRNFLTTVLRLAGERETLRIVDDQWGAPTYAAQLARAALAAFDQALRRPEFPSGIYHVCNGGETTWCGFARAILDRAVSAGHAPAPRSVVPIASSEYRLPARRPLNSRLNTDKFSREFGIRLPPWRAGLAECIEHYRFSDI